MRAAGARSSTEESGKLFFNILDYTGSAFDGDPSLVNEEKIDEEGDTVEEHCLAEEQETIEEQESTPEYDDENPLPRKFYVHGGKADIDTEVTYDLDADGS